MTFFLPVFFYPPPLDSFSFFKQCLNVFLHYLSFLAIFSVQCKNVKPYYLIHYWCVLQISVNHIHASEYLHQKRIDNFVCIEQTFWIYIYLYMF